MKSWHKLQSNRSVLRRPILDRTGGSQSMPIWPGQYTPPHLAHPWGVQLSLLISRSCKMSVCCRITLSRNILSLNCRFRLIIDRLLLCSYSRQLFKIYWQNCILDHPSCPSLLSTNIYFLQAIFLYLHHLCSSNHPVYFVVILFPYPSLWFYKPYKMKLFHTSYEIPKVC